MKKPNGDQCKYFTHDTSHRLYFIFHIQSFEEIHKHQEKCMTYHVIPIPYADLIFWPMYIICNNKIHSYPNVYG